MRRCLISFLITFFLGTVYSQTSKPIYYTVQPQNTLYSIARWNDVSVEDVKKWNGLTSNDILIGQRLIVGYENAPEIKKPEIKKVKPEPVKTKEKVIPAEKKDTTEIIDKAFYYFNDSRDNERYKAIKIGNQIWMAENLRYDILKQSICLDNATANCEKFGRLYKWKNIEEICPQSWHVPTQQEWRKLLENVGGRLVAYDLLVPGGTGFDVLISGYYDFFETKFIKGISSFLTATAKSNERTDESGLIVVFEFSPDLKDVVEYNGSKESAFSCRCIKD